MKRLYILRHAKSSWAQPGLGDMERPLNERGRNQLIALKSWFIEQETKPDTVLCSPAERTRETYQGLETALSDATCEIVSPLYNGSMDAYLDALKIQSADCILIIGHNPTCDELCRYLAAPSSPCFEKLFNHHFGTANLGVFDCPIDDWSDLKQASGQLIDFVRPKDLVSN